MSLSFCFVQGKIWLSNCLYQIRAKGDKRQDRQNKGKAAEGGQGSRKWANAPPSHGEPETNLLQSGKQDNRRKKVKAG